MHKNIEAAELDKFDAMAADWWDPKGKCRPLHALNPMRLQFIVDRCSLVQKTFWISGAAVEYCLRVYLNAAPLLRA